MNGTEDYITEYAILVTKFTQYQYRLSSGKVTVDIYPVNRRFHVIEHPTRKGERGAIGENTILFLEEIFTTW